MDLSSIDYVNFTTIIKRGTAEIIEEGDDYCFLMDTVSGTYMLACDDPEQGKELLTKYEDRKYELIMTLNKEIAEFAGERYGLSHIEECYQYAYTGEMPEEDPRIKLRSADLNDLPVIMSVYDMISDEEMAEDIGRGGVMMAYRGDDLVGFIGEHAEGSQGMLYVFPEFRRNGYAEALEHACFRKKIREGFTPFGQVITDNLASESLQNKMKLTKSGHLYYWVF